MLEEFLKSIKLLGLDRERLQIEFLKYKDKLTLSELICCNSLFSSQKLMPIIEEKIISILKATRNRISDQNGDFNYNGINYELKTTIITKTNPKMNFVQIREAHDCDYLFVVGNTLLNECAKAFFIPKDIVITTVNRFGGSAHGLKSTNPLEKRMTLPLEYLSNWKSYETNIFKD